MKELYSIEARSYDLRGIASHNFWVLRDENLGVVSQLHGLATDRNSNHFKPIGFFNDRLGFYEFKAVDNGPSFISKTQRAVTVYRSDIDDVLARWNKAAYKIESLNNRDLNYSPFGILGWPITNSNSAYHLFAKIMEIECCRFPCILEPGINNALSFCHSTIDNTR